MNNNKEKLKGYHSFVVVSILEFLKKEQKRVRTFKKVNLWLLLYESITNHILNLVTFTKYSAI